MRQDDRQAKDSSQSPIDGSLKAEEARARAGTIGDRAEFLMKYGPPPSNRPKFRSMRQWCIAAGLKQPGHLANFMTRWRKDKTAGMDHDSLSKLAAAQGVEVLFFSTGKGDVWQSKVRSSPPEAHGHETFDLTLEYLMKRRQWYNRLIEAMQKMRADVPPGWQPQDVVTFLENLAKAMSECDAEHNHAVPP